MIILWQKANLTTNHQVVFSLAQLERVLKRPKLRVGVGINNYQKMCDINNKLPFKMLKKEE
jgi:hypothetical protein